MLSWLLKFTWPALQSAHFLHGKVQLPEQLDVSTPQAWKSLPYKKKCKLCLVVFQNLLWFRLWQCLVVKDMASIYTVPTGWNPINLDRQNWHMDGMDRKLWGNDNKIIERHNSINRNKTYLTWESRIQLSKALHSTSSSGQSRAVQGTAVQGSIILGSWKYRELYKA